MQIPVMFRFRWFVEQFDFFCVYYSFHSRGWLYIESGYIIYIEIALFGLLLLNIVHH